jgi:hypothetical protein
LVRWPAGITRESHYVPQATLRRWSDDGVNLWAYQPLLAKSHRPQLFCIMGNPPRSN